MSLGVEVYAEPQRLNLKRKFLSCDCEEYDRRESQQIVPLFIFSASVRLRHDVCRSLPVCAEVQLQLCQRHCSVSEARLLDALQLGDHGLACPLSSSFLGRASKDVRLNVSTWVIKESTNSREVRATCSAFRSLFHFLRKPKKLKTAMSLDEYQPRKAAEGSGVT